MVKLSTIIFAIYSSLAFAGCVGGCAQAEESPFAHVKTAEDAQAMIMGVAIAKAASQRCPGVGIDAIASEELLDHCRRIIGKSAVERALAEDIKKVAKDAETGDFCEDVKGAARLGFNYLMTVDGVQTGLDDRLDPYTIHNGDGQ